MDQSWPNVDEPCCIDCPDQSWPDVDEVMSPQEFVRAMQTLSRQVGKSLDQAIGTVLRAGYHVGRSLQEAEERVNHIQQPTVYRKPDGTVSAVIPRNNGPYHEPFRRHGGSWKK